MSEAKSRYVRACVIDLLAPVHFDFDPLISEIAKVVKWRETKTWPMPYDGGDEAYPEDEFDLVRISLRDGSFYKDQIPKIRAVIERYDAGIKIEEIEVWHTRA